MIIWTRSFPVPVEGTVAPEPDREGDRELVVDPIIRLASRAAGDRRLGVLLAIAPATAMAFQPLSLAAAEALAARDPQRLRRLGAPEALIALVAFPRVHGVLFPN